MNHRSMLLASFSLAALAAWFSPGAQARALTAGNIIVSNSPFGEQDLFEVTPKGTIVQQIPVSPANGGRDLVVDRDGRVQLYNGTFDPTLTTYDPAKNQFSSRTFANWSTVNNLTYGGIAAFGRYLYATDMSTGTLGDPQGVVRFDLDGGATVRFATNIEPIDLAVGLDGYLYTLSRGNAFNGGGTQVDVYNPESMAFVRSVTLPFEHRAIAIDANGDIYTAQRDSLSRIDHFSPSGTLLDSIGDSGVGGLSDIDINRDGGLLLASHGGVVLLTTTALDSVEYFQTRECNGTNFAAWVQAPVPEPMIVGPLFAGMVVLSMRYRAATATRHGKAH